MKSFLFTASLILGCSQMLFAQEVEVQSSDELVNQSNTTFFREILGYNANGYFILRKGGQISNEEILIEQYSKTFKLINTTRVPNSFGVMGDSKLHRYTIMNNGKIYHFYDGWNKKEGKSSLILYLSDENGAPLKEEHVLEIASAPSQMNSAWFKYVFSPDGSKLLITTEMPFEKGSTEKFKVQVFSTSDLSALWSQTINYEFESKRNPSNLTAVNNQGTVVIFKEHNEGRKERVYQWISVSKNGVKTNPLTFNNSYATATTIVVEQNDGFTLSGIAAELGKNISTWQSILHLRASKDGELLSFSNPFISAETIRKIASEKAANTPGYTLNDYKLLHVFVNSKQQTYLVVEEQSASKTLVGQSQPPVYNNTLNNGKVIVIALDESGEQVWSAVINKRQTESTLDLDVTFGSVVCLMQNDKLYFVWNHINFEREAVTGKRYWVDKIGSKIYVDHVFGKEAIFPTFLTVLNENGQFVYEDRTFNALPLTKIQEPNAYPMAIDPSIYVQTENGVVVLSRMEGRSAKRYKFSTISF